MAKRGPKQGQKFFPLSKERRETFLKVLLDTGGNWAAACRAASPHLVQRDRPSHSAWRSLIARDPEFAAQVEEVKQEVRDTMEAELYRRAVHGVSTAVYQKAQRVYEPEIDEATGQPVLDENGNPKMKPASITRYSDTALLKRLAAEMPEKYGEKRTIAINHQIEHRGAWRISTDDLQALSASQRDNLRSIMTTIRDHRREMANLPDPGWQGNEKTIDHVGYKEVTSD